METINKSTRSFLINQGRRFSYKLTRFQRANLELFITVYIVVGCSMFFLILQILPSVCGKIKIYTGKSLSFISSRLETRYSNKSMVQFIPVT